MSKTLPIKHVAKLLGTQPKTVYKHIERKRYKKDDKTAAVDTESFRQYVAKIGSYHEKMYRLYANIYNRL